MEVFSKIDLLMDAVTMLSLLPFGKTGSIWQKSPPRTTIIPPNGLSLIFSFLCLNISLRVIPSESEAYLVFHWRLIP
jgi:hypothetical protein